MRLALSKRIGLMLAAVLLFGMAGSGLALWAARYQEENLEDLIAVNLEQARVIHELEIALLEQGGLAAYYVLDGGTRWTEELRRRQPFFERWMEGARRVGLEHDQQAYLSRIAEAFRRYEQHRDEAIAAVDDGRGEAARQLLIDHVYPAYDRTYQLCEELSRANDQDIESTVRDRREQARVVRAWSWTLLGAAGLSVAGLGWLLVVRVWGPIREMARSVRGTDESAPSRSTGDELQVISSGLEKLRSGVAEASWQLERSHRHLLDAQQLASVGRLAAGVAHEIRSPLTALRLRLFSIQKALAGAPERHADVRVMSEEIERLEAMVSSFLEFSRPPTLNLQRCSISLILEKTLELLRYKLEANRIHCQYDESGPLPPLLADAQQLKQVFLNLVGNAIDVLPDGGTIRINVDSQQRAVERPCMTVRISDDGPGIPEQVAARIFDPFFSTKDTGAGLGLWIAHRIVAEHEGVLELERSAPGETVFAVAIPTAEPVTIGEELHGQNTRC